MMHTRVLVVVPTYNERDTIETLLSGLTASYPNISVLVVDDGSPDQTATIVRSHPAFGAQVSILERSGKQGLGTAYLAGFAWGLARDFDIIVEMDADGSHRVADLPRLLDAIAHADVVQGSRWVDGGATQRWPWYRQLISRGGSAYARWMLRLDIRDVTGGFRAYTAEALRSMQLKNVESAGYCFQIDMLRRAVQAGLTIVEVPITFVERGQGKSKMSSDIVIEAMWRVTLWGFELRFGGFGKG